MFVPRSELDPSIAPWRASALGALVSVGGLLLFFSTWRLWINQELCPQVPFCAWGVLVPGTIDLVLAAVLLLTLSTALMLKVGSTWSRRCFLVFGLSLTGLVLLDQHRFQPWAWQLFLIAGLLATLPAERAWFWLRLLTVGIYFHSALSKLDVSFFDGPAQWFLSVIVPEHWLEQWSQTTRRFVAFLFPGGELLVAIGLCLPASRWRNLALSGSLVMHLLMLWILGPWGLNHQPGVLLWNLFFIVQNVILFWPAVPATPADSGESSLQNVQKLSRSNSVRLGSLCSRAIVLGAVLFPFLEPWGWYDHWPAWALYATHGERVTVLLSDKVRPRLSPRLQKFTRPAGEPGWHQLQWDRWSLASLKAPVYPQDRFLLGMTRGLAKQHQLETGDVRVVLESPADRWTGERTTRVLNSPSELVRECERFWWNTRPRSWPSR